LGKILAFFLFLGDKFRELWGEYAGWAQTVMFIDDLKGFQKEKLETATLSMKQEVITQTSYDDLAKNVKVEPSTSIDSINIKTESIKRSSSSNSINNKKRVRKSK